MEKIKWTKSYIESLNDRLDKAGFSSLKFIIDGGFVYKDELHRLCGIGIKLEEEEES